MKYEDSLKEIKYAWMKDPERVCQAIKIVSIILLVFEFGCTAGLYFVLKTYVSQFWAEVFIMACFAIALKNSIDDSVKTIFNMLNKKDDENVEDDQMS